jgi:hypothetical protein
MKLKQPTEANQQVETHGQERCDKDQSENVGIKPWQYGRQKKQNDQKDRRGQQRLYG